MKKIALILIACVLSVACFTGCTSTGKSFFGVVKGVVIQDDYEAAGRMVGEAGYMAYLIMKGDPKYDKYTTKAEEIYAALDNAESFNTASMNQVILEIAQAALTARYGYVKAALITDGIRVGGVIADRLILKDVTAEDATLYAKGLKAGIDEARSRTPLSALDAAAAQAAAKADKDANGDGAEAAEAKTPKYITCKKGESCHLAFTNRTVDVQLAIAKELKDFNFLDENEQRIGDNRTKAENVQALVARAEKLQSLGITRLNVWISDVWTTPEGKLSNIKFLYEEFNGDVLETDCVSCIVITEKD